MMYWWVIGLLVLALGIWMFLSKKSKGNGQKGKQNPSDILDERFAKGELSKEEYEEQKRTLNS